LWLLLCIPVLAFPVAAACSSTRQQPAVLLGQRFLRLFCFADVGNFASATLVAAVLMPVA